MVLAALQETDNLYRVLVLLHVLTVIVGFGSTFVYPVIGNYASKHPGLEGMGISDSSMLAGDRLTLPAIYSAGVLGLILVLVGPYGFDDPWVGISLLLFLAAVVFSHFVHVANLKKMNGLIHELVAMGPSGPSEREAQGPPPEGATGGPPPQVLEMEKRGKDAARNGGILHLIFLVILVMMIFGTRGAFT
jgi:Predicted integral membrane protein (DUF2269)